MKWFCFSDKDAEIARLKAELAILRDRQFGMWTIMDPLNDLELELIHFKESLLAVRVQEAIYKIRKRLTI